MSKLIFCAALIQFVSARSLSQDLPTKTIEIVSGVVIGVGHYPNGVTINFASGKKENESTGIGWFLGANKSWWLNPKFNFSEGLHIQKCSYFVNYTYPDGNSIPLVLSLEKYNYLFASFRSSLSYHLLTTKTVHVLPYTGGSFAVLMDSNVDQKFEDGTRTQTGNQNLTDKEDKLNFTLLAGLKIVIGPDNKFPLTINGTYDQFFKEQFAFGSTGRKLRSFQIGVGIML